MSDVSDKIRKLMALADHPGTGPEESSAAAAMAAELAMKYNIDLEAARRGPEPSRKTFGRGTDRTEAVGGHRQAMCYVAGAVAALYGCKFLVWQMRTGKTGVQFVGQPHNVAMAETWYDYLWSAAKRADSAYRKGKGLDTAKAKYTASVSFRLNFSYIIWNRLNEKLQAMRTSGISNGTALVVSNWLDQERKEVELWMKETMKTKISRNGTRKSNDFMAGLAGAEAGKRTSIDEQLAPRQSHKQIA